MRQSRQGVVAVRLGFELSQQQLQRLVLTPELRQAIAILQLPVQELQAFIDRQLQENPVLEVRDETEEEAAEAPPALEDPTWLNYLDDEGESPPPGPLRLEPPAVERFTAPGPTLPEHLTMQLRLLPLGRGDRRLAEFLIGSLDDRGYLTLSVAEAAAATGAPPEQVERVRRLIQGFDPAGVAALNLRECLLLQWSQAGGDNPLVLPLIADHLPDLAAGRIGRIAAALGTTPAAVQAAADVVRALDPRPGRRFGGAEARYIVPDLVVERVGGSYAVLINDTLGPRLGLSPYYRRLLAGGGECDPAARRFLEQKLNAALWVIRSIEQRRLTLLRVMEAVVGLQQPFFERGSRHLRPLTLREVADQVAVHESTVSRAVAGKYAQTPRGTFAVRFFFSSGVAGEQGEGVAAESVKGHLRDLVAAEDPRTPLSDQALAGALAGLGVHISRRTVAKYREEISVPASARRRRYL